MGRAWEVVRPQGSHCEVAAVTTAVMLELEQTHTHMQECAHQFS